MIRIQSLIDDGEMVIIIMQNPRLPLQRVFRNALTYDPGDADYPANRRKDGGVIRSLHALADEVQDAIIAEGRNYSGFKKERLQRKLLL